MKRMAGGRLVWLPVFLLFAACTNPCVKLFDFDAAKSIEVGVSYVTMSGRGEIFIDRVAFQ